jgi:hypothetical protein
VGPEQEAVKAAKEAEAARARWRRKEQSLADQIAPVLEGESPGARREGRGGEG